MKFGKRLMSLALALVMIFGLTVNASAAGAAQSVTAKLSPDITVETGGKAQALADANGNPVYPVLYNGTTYLPVRAVSNLLWLNVEWDQATRTVLLSSFSGTTPPTVTNGNTAANAAPTDITAQIDPGVTVKYKGETQQMTDASGNPVYPMLYNGTTYVPIRAIGNMLNLGVDWDQDTRTITLIQLPRSSSGVSRGFDENGVCYRLGNDKRNVKAMRDQITVQYDDGKIETFGHDELGAAYAASRSAGFSSENVIKLIQAFVDVCNEPEPVYTSPFGGVSTTSDVNSKFISGTCVARDWAELDWTHADDGYVTVRVNELAGPNTRVSVSVRYSNGTRYAQSDTNCDLTQGEWRIPLRGGSTEYVIELSYKTLTCKHMLTETEYKYTVVADTRLPSKLVAKFNAEISNPEAVWTMSTPYADFEKAPKTQAKAKELTKNCKTDAEKVTAIFNWVATNIKYDNQLSAALDTWEMTRKTDKSCMIDPNGKHLTASPSNAADYYDLDKIITNKSGICAHYAALTVGMLRSLGIPCRAVSGEAYTGGEWGGHAWVEISPDVTGLNKTALGAGTGTDGWTRIDPTWGASSNAANDSNYRSSSFYF